MHIDGGCHCGNITYEALEALSVTDIMRAQLRTTADLGVLEGILPWQPSLDDDLLPEPPLAAIGKGLSRSVPMLVGTNRDEWRLFLITDPRARSLDEERLARRFRRILARLGEAEVSLPGGCAIGSRPVNLHTGFMDSPAGIINFTLSWCEFSICRKSGRDINNIIANIWTTINYEDISIFKNSVIFMIMMIRMIRTRSNLCAVT